MTGARPLSGTDTDADHDGSLSIGQHGPTAPAAEGGYVYHVLNRAGARLAISDG